MSFVLGKDEETIETKEFTTNLVLAWLKTNFTITSKRLVGYNPNTLFGLIPLGKVEITYPLKNIASVGVSTKFHFKRFFIGLLLFLTGISTLGSSILGGLILLSLGALLLLNSYTSTLNISNSAGQSHMIEISILEKTKVEDFANTVNKSVADVA